jgi:drug/metabolite transporter (DMT)-like permease
MTIFPQAAMSTEQASPSPLIPNEGRGYLFAVLTALITSIGFIAAKPVLDRLDPLSFSVSQFALATLFSFIWMAAAGDIPKFKKVTPGQWTFLIVVALLFLGAAYTLWIGLSRIPATSSALLHRLEVLVTVFFGMALLGDRFTKREAIGGLIVVFGVLALRFQSPPEFSAGFWMMVLSSTLFGVIEVLVKTQVHAIPPRVFAFSRNLLVLVFFAIAAVWRLVMKEDAGWQGLIDWSGIREDLPLIAVVALVGPVLGRTAYMYSLRHLPVSRAALVMQSQPLFVALLSAILLSAWPSQREWTSGLLIVAGCLMLVQWRGRFRISRAPSDQESA